jgi:hypothetical protein
MTTTATEPQCTFVATDGRRCILHEWHKAPRPRKGHYRTYGDIGDGHLLAGGQSCKWGDAPKHEESTR